MNPPSNPRTATARSAMQAHNAAVSKLRDERVKVWPLERATWIVECHDDGCGGWLDDPASLLFASTAPGRVADDKSEE